MVMTKDVAGSEDSALKINFTNPQGTYVVAVSGGVDSVALLHVLVQRYPEHSYIVAHINHGIRDDAGEDAQLVAAMAAECRLPFELASLQLGKNASEAEAREARYAFLHSVKAKHQANGIITAHHQNDVIETMFINLLRGTGRRGISSLGSSSQLIRPLLHLRKQDMYQYAKQHSLNWREDSTNADKKYLRNKIRHDVVQKMTPDQHKQVLDIVSATAHLNAEIDKELQQLLRRGLHKGQPVLSRKWFAQLPHDIACEAVYIVLKNNGGQAIDKKTIERVVVAIKTLSPGKTIQASGVDILLTKRSARFILRSKTDAKPV